LNNTLRVSNLPLSFDSSILEDLFTMVGNVQKAEIAMDSVSGVSRGFGVVVMSTSEEAQDCISHFNGLVKMGQAMVVREDVPHVPKITIEKSIKRRPAFKKATRAVSRTIKGDRR
jgi:RNA recognition motif-containing protein